MGHLGIVLSCPYFVACLAVTAVNSVHGQDCDQNGVPDEGQVSSLDFRYALKVPVPGGASAITSADIDSDGFPDLVTANRDNHTVSILLGRGRTPSVRQVPVGGRLPSSVITDDFNGDGFVDLATGNQGSKDVSILLGHGDGDFEDPRVFAVDGEPRDLVAADLDGDGISDIVMINRWMLDLRALVVLPGVGDGSFELARTFPGAKGQPRSLVAADLDGDGLIDAAATFAAESTIAGIALYSGIGNGDFAPEVEIPVGCANPRELLALDVDRDGRLDLAALSGPNHLSVLLGLGSGKFTPGGCMPAGHGPNAIIARDFDRDGHIDFATSDSIGYVALLLGDGAGSFRDHSHFTAGWLPVDLVAADFDGDGYLDVATASERASEVVVMWGSGAAELETARQFDSGDSTARAMVAHDFNGDGHLDLATANGDESISVLLGIGDGTFSEESRHVPGGDSQSLAMTDLDGDGFSDLVTASDRSDRVIVRYGTGDGGFRGTASVFATGERPVDLLVADLDDDGIDDLATVNIGDQTISVMLGNGRGSFYGRVDLLMGVEVDSLTVADFNRDGLTDFAVSAFRQDGVFLFVATGSGEYTAHGSLDILRPSLVRAADINEDGNPDLVTLDYRRGDTGDLSVYMGEGDGRFLPAERFPMPSQPESAFVIDLNRDGRLDVVALSHDAGAVVVLLQQTDGSLRREPEIFLGNFASAIVAGDFNHDGALDLAAATNSGGVEVLLQHVVDCNRNRVPDACDIESGFSADEDANGVPDECEADCNGNGFLDGFDLANRISPDCNTNGIPDECDIEKGEPDLDSNGIPDVCRGSSFHRGDANGDGDLDISDSTFGLQFQIFGGPSPSCLQAADANGDLEIDISDPIFVLNWVFLGGPPPPLPGPPGSPCGIEPTALPPLDCASYPACEEA